jgi:cell division protein FtsZ
VANEKTTVPDAFAMADQVLYSGVACITDLVVKEGLINLDFADVRAVMREMGKAMMGTGEASGDKRALRSAEAAISNPLMDDVSLRGARGLLISITGGKDLTLYEVDEAATRIREEVDADANIIVGATFDESLDGIIRVSVVATGVDIDAANNVRPPGTSHALPPTHASASPQARAPRPGVAPSPGAVPFKAEPNVASALAEDAPAEHARERKSSRGLEAELIAVDELCAKLITLAPPETAIPLLKERTPEKPVEPGGRKPLLTWPPLTFVVRVAKRNPDTADRIARAAFSVCLRVAERPYKARLDQPQARASLSQRSAKAP